MSYRAQGNSKYQEFDPETGDLNRKRSLVKPERSRMDLSRPNYHYSQVANQQSSHLKILPSTTGVEPIHSNEPQPQGGRNNSLPVHYEEGEGEEDIPLMDLHQGIQSKPQNGAGREVYGLNDEIEYSPKRNDVIKNSSTGRRKVQPMGGNQKERSSNYPIWNIYCYIITFWAPGPLLKLFGLKSKDQQFAWREKIALISCILYCGALVSFIVFGFTRTVCLPSPQALRNNFVSPGYLIINGRAFDMTRSQHPGAAGINAGSNILYPPVAAGGMDASFLFQNVNGNCKGLIKARDNSSIPHSDDQSELAWYMPCNLYNQDGSSSPNFTAPFYNGWACHTSDIARSQYYGLKVSGDVYFTWDDIKNSTRNLMVYNGNVLDMDLINWFSTDDLTYPELFDKLRDEKVYKGHDVSVVLTNSAQRQAARCLTEIVKVGKIDSQTVGCIASNILLYVTLVFILSVVVSRFLMACYFRWWISGRQGATEIDNKSMAQRNKEIDNWVDNPTTAAPMSINTIPVEQRANYHTSKTNRQSVFVKANSNRFSAHELDKPSHGQPSDPKAPKYTTMSTQAALFAKKGSSNQRNVAHSANRNSMYNVLSGGGSSHDLHMTTSRAASIYNPFEDFAISGLSPDLLHPDIVPQPPVDYQPFGYPLLHTMVLVTCYSEDEIALRTTLDSVATTDYPNSHKLIFIVCDGLIKGSGNDLTTPEIALSMMTDFSVAPEDVVPCSYVAVAQGSKRHNMAKVYSGFYKYNDDTVPQEKQQRVPVVCIVKCGTPSEANSAKPGNRGKRDSQIILMSFLQKVMFDERMTEFDFEVFNNIWRITGLMTEFYEATLMVDADTRVYPDCLTHMIAELVRDPMIMGLCGETKISNKRQSWVTAIQVFEYYISHHQSKAFESVFGGVTCLPGCFCMYRIKAPKGNNGYWVPILANPDIVERYSDNVTDTLHKKNLLLLGEDRYLSALMLRTFPKRQQIFVPKAACKTIVPDTFSVLLSQRRRWINSTVHNLMELVLVNDLCGTFCFSMQFVIMVDLIGTLILPIAICITVYVIIFAIVSHPTPIMSLVLLAIIFGLPAILIVITISSASYLIYFVIYMFALPVWNFVLPTYAFWKFDDFSWGETRTVMGDVKGDHANADGEFDSSHITMKRWREYERDRRSKENNKAAGGLSIPRATWDPAASEKEEGDFSSGSTP